MYFCEVCKKEFDCHKKLGGHTSSHRKSKKHIEYDLNPKNCEECQNPISWDSYKENHKILFCSCSCRAKNFHKNRK
jgi:hypothetical protein